MVGRNDPCPCGSGKKYKNCCLRQKRVEASRRTNLSGQEATLFGELVRFILQPRFAGELLEATAVFWRGRYPAEVLRTLEEHEQRRFLEWFIFDRPFGEERRRIIDLFLEKEGMRYPEQERALLQAWAASFVIMARYVRRLGEGRVLLYEPLRAVEHVAMSRLLALNAQPGDVVVGRLYEVEGEKRLAATTLILPPEFEVPLDEYIQRAYQLYQEEHPTVSPEDFWKANGHLAHVFLLSEHAEGLRSLIGPGTRFYDPAVTRERMRAAAAALQSVAPEVISPFDLAPEQGVEKTSQGIVLPRAEEPGEKDEQRPTILVPGRDI